MLLAHVLAAWALQRVHINRTVVVAALTKFCYITGFVKKRLDLQQTIVQAFPQIDLLVVSVAPSCSLRSVCYKPAVKKFCWEFVQFICFHCFHLSPVLHLYQKCQPFLLFTSVTMWGALPWHSRCDACHVTPHYICTGSTDFHVKTWMFHLLTSRLLSVMQSHFDTGLNIARRTEDLKRRPFFCSFCSFALRPLDDWSAREKS